MNIPMQARIRKMTYIRYIVTAETEAPDLPNDQRLDIRMFLSSNIWIG